MKIELTSQAGTTCSSGEKPNEVTIAGHSCRKVTVLLAGDKEWAPTEDELIEIGQLFAKVEEGLTLVVQGCDTIHIILHDYPEEGGRPR